MIQNGAECSTCAAFQLLNMLKKDLCTSKEISSRSKFFYCCYKYPPVHISKFFIFLAFTNMKPCLKKHVGGWGVGFSEGQNTKGSGRFRVAITKHLRLADL